MNARTSSTWSAPARRIAARLTAVVTLLVLLGGGLVGPPVAAAAPPRSPGTVTVSGYDYRTAAVADVVAGDPDTNLVVTFTARRALEDGTLTLALPTRDWWDPLFVGARLSPMDPTLRGAVVVRPSVTYDDLTDADCRTAGNETLPVPVSVANDPTVRTATVSHLSCAAGQSITLRVFDVRAPQRVGRVQLLTTVRDGAGGSSTVLPLDVRPVPTTRLVVTPAQEVSVLTGDVVPVTVTAIDTRGGRDRVDTRYRGTVNLIAVGTDCYVSVDPAGPVTFTADDRGTRSVRVSFGALQRFQMEAYDVARRALPGYSASIYVSPGPGYEPTTCSRAYH